jgi:hypothetical protein
MVLQLTGERIYALAANLPILLNLRRKAALNDQATQRKASLNWKSSFLIACVLIFLLLLVLALYTLVHESGHALIGLLFGGKITSFSLNFFNLSAHVGIDGNFTLAQQALISTAGILLPLLLCMGFILLSEKRTDTILEWFKILLFASAVNSLLAWIAIPILVMMGKTIGDDSANFLNYTHLSPVLVTGAALLVYAVCWVLFLGRMGGFQALLARLRVPSIDLTLPETRKTMLSLAALAVITLIASLGLTQAFPDRTFDAPSGYQRVADLDLFEKGFIDQKVYQFTLQERGKVSFYFALKDIQGAPTSIRLTGPAGYDNTFFEVKDNKSEISLASVHPQGIALEKGDYEIRVTFQPSPGWVRAFIKME